MIRVLPALTTILLAAKLRCAVMVHLRQPEVLSELIVGIMFGNVALLGIQSFSFRRYN